MHVIGTAFFGESDSSVYSDSNSSHQKSSFRVLVNKCSEAKSLNPEA